MRFWTDLPREGRLLLSIVAVEFLGSGLVLPFAVVYLHEVRGFSLTTAGLLLALPPLLSLAAAGPGGAAVDRVGPRRMVVGILLLTIASDVVLAFSTRPWIAAVAFALAGLSGGAQWSAFQSMIASVVPSELRPRYFGINFTLINLGVGLGGLLGGVFVNVHRPGTFVAIYLADAASFLPALILMLGPLRHVGGAVAAPDEGGGPTVSYLAVLRGRAMPSMVALSFLTSFVGYAQLDAGLSAYARVVGGISTRSLGFAYAANTFVIVVLQLFVLQRIEGKRRTRVLGVMSLVWAASWALLGMSGLVPGTLGASLLVAGGMMVFALGETLLQPTVPVLVNALAPDHLRGRYNAVSGAAFSVAAVIAPPVAGILIGHGLGGVQIALLVAGCLACGGLAVGRLERELPPEVNGVLVATGPGPVSER